ncbi:unnamed protein product, partial [Iphiclides podalirius]
MARIANTLCGLRRSAWVRRFRVSAQTGAPYRAMDRTTPAYKRRQESLGPPTFGSSLPRAAAAFATLGASRSKWARKSHRRSKTRPRYLIVGATSTRTPHTIM